MAASEVHTQKNQRHNCERMSNSTCVCADSDVHTTPNTKVNTHPNIICSRQSARGKQIYAETHKPHRKNKKTCASSDLAVAHVEDAVCELAQVHIVRDHDHGDAVLPVQLNQNPHHYVAVLRVQVSPAFRHACFL